MISEVMPIGMSQVSFNETAEELHILYVNSGGTASPKLFCTTSGGNSKNLSKTKCCTTEGVKDSQDPKPQVNKN